MKLKSVLAAAILAVGLGGCKVNGPVIPYEKRNSVSAHTGVSYRAAFSPTFYDLNIKSKYIEPHPDDTGFITGTSNVKAKDGVDALRGYLGLSGEIGTENIALTAGTDATFSLTSLIDKGGLGNLKQHDGDPRSGSSGSCVYDKVEPPAIGFRPFVGARTEIKDWNFNAELGFPYGKWKREWGHHRYNREQRIGSESDTTWGIRPALNITRSFEELRIGLEVAYEDWNLDFGRARGYSAAITLTF